MSKIRLTYFDAPVSRGEECRLALHIAGVDFDDNRIKRDQWAALKPTTPFGSLPVLDVPGHPPLAQSNAILTLVGRLHGLHPADPYEAARHESIMQHVEDLRAQISPTLRIQDEAEKKKAREAIAANTLPAWGASTEKHIGDGPFFGGAKLHVADLKLFVAVRWIKSGALDHIPATALDAFPKLTRQYDAVASHPGVRSWHAKG
jgi:glutathione S-transferase